MCTTPDGTGQPLTDGSRWEKSIERLLLAGRGHRAVRIDLRWQKSCASAGTHAGVARAATLTRGRERTRKPLIFSVPGTVRAAWVMAPALQPKMPATAQGSAVFSRWRLVKSWGGRVGGQRQCTHRCEHSLACIVMHPHGAPDSEARVEVVPAAKARIRTMESMRVKGRLENFFFPPCFFVWEKEGEKGEERGVRSGMPYNRKARRRRGGRGTEPEQRMPEVSAAPPCHSSAFFSPRYT